MIPPDSVVPPLKPADIGGTTDDHHAHAEHAMDPSPGNFNIFPFFSLFSEINKTIINQRIRI
jgi:hypothetical protein